MTDRFSVSGLLATMREAGSAAVAIPLFVLLFGLATTFFVPAVALMVTAGVTWGFWPGWVVVWAAANVWANVHFWVGRWLAADDLRPWLERKGAGWLVRELEQGGALTTIMVRQLPLPYPIVNLSAGASPMHWRQWVVGNALGLVPNCLIYTQLAAALADGVEGAREQAAMRVVTAAAGVISLSLLSRWLQRRFARA
ncbi:MAG: TVP38/TMEM64 family protein [Myxococcota bacterium]